MHLNGLDEKKVLQNRSVRIITAHDSVWSGIVCVNDKKEKIWEKTSSASKRHRYQRNNQGKKGH